MPITRAELAKLDWIGILEKAIENRPTSWGFNPVAEWRNASDEIYFGVLKALKEEGILRE